MNSGYTSKQISDLLGVGSETFRYWKRYLPNNPAQNRFSGRDFIAYLIYKNLIVKKHFRIRNLRCFPTERIFIFCREHMLSEISAALVIFDESDYTIEFYKENYTLDIYNINLTYLPLKGIVESAIQMLINFGCQNKLIKHAY